MAVKPGKNCKQVKGDKTRVRCKTTKTPAKVIVRLYDRNDSVVNNSDLKMEAYGGRGNDVCNGRYETVTLVSCETFQPW